jgi:hypothetical protein
MTNERGQYPSSPKVLDKPGLFQKFQATNQQHIITTVQILLCLIGNSPNQAGSELECDFPMS